MAMGDSKQARVADAVWSSRNVAADAPARPRPVLRAAISRALILFVLSAVFYFWLGWVRIPAAMAVAGAAMIVLGAAWRRGFAAVDRFAVRFGRLIGQALTWGLLTPLYWLFFAVIGNLARLTGKDPLLRRFETGTGTYWIERGRDSKPKDYSRQF